MVNREKIDKFLGLLLVLLILLPAMYGVLALGAVRLRDQAVIGVSIAIATVLWIIRLFLGRHRILWPRVTGAVLLFLGYAVIRYFSSDVEYVARKELWRILACTWFFVIVINSIRRQEYARLVVLALIALAALEAFYGLYQFLKGSDMVLWYPRPEVYHGRGSGTYVCPNHLAGFLEMVWPMALAMVLLGRLKDVGKIIIGYLAIVIAGGLVATLSRAGWLSAFVTFAIFLAITLRRIVIGRRVLIIALLLIGLGIGAISYVVAPKWIQLQKRITTSLKPGQPASIQVRWDLMRATVRMWWDHRWFGVGPGHFDVRWPQYRPPTIQSRPIWAHNDYLNLLADYGLVGGVIVGLGIWLLWRGAGKTWRNVSRGEGNLGWKRSDRAAVLLGAGLGLIAMGIHSFFDFNLHIPANALICTLLVGLVASHERYATRSVWVRSKWRLEIPLAIFGILCAGFLAAEGIHGFREEYWTVRAETAATVGEQVAAFHRAVVIEPKNPELVAKLAEVYRLGSWEGGDGWEWLAQRALFYFQKAVKLNRWDPYPQLRIGMCLDWLGKAEEAERYFDRAVRLDPNNYYVALMRGWHALQKGDLAEAKKWIQRSLELKPWENWIAKRYLSVVEERMKEKSGI